MHLIYVNVKPSAAAHFKYTGEKIKTLWGLCFTILYLPSGLSPKTTNPQGPYVTSETIWRGLPTKKQSEKLFEVHIGSTLRLRSQIGNWLNSCLQEVLNAIAKNERTTKSLWQARATTRIRGYTIKMVRRSIFDQIFKEMQNIRFRLEDLENSISGWNPQPLEISESKLISLPDHLRRSYIVVVSKGECSALQVSNLTGRCRAIESNYLNQLSRMGWLNKRRVSKTTHFRAVSAGIINTHDSLEPVVETSTVKMANLRHKHENNS